MYGIIYTVHAPLCSIHFLISLIDKKSPFPMLYNPTFLYTFVFSISWLLNPAMYAYKYRLAFLSETNRWLSINYQTKKVCQTDCLFVIPYKNFFIQCEIFEPILNENIINFCFQPFYDEINIFCFLISTSEHSCFRIKFSCRHR